MTTMLRSAAFLSTVLFLLACDPARQPPAHAQEDGAGSGRAGETAGDTTEKKGTKKTKGTKEEESAASQTQKDKKKRPEKVYAPQDPAKGYLVGTVTFKGPVPDLPPIKIPDNSAEKAHCAGHVKNDVIILGKGRRLQNAVLFIDGYQTREKPFHKTVTVDNIRCAFKPRISSVTRGTQVVFTNSDPFLHNIHTFLDASFNLAVLPKRSIKKRMRKPGWVIVKCDVHPYMLGHIRVFSHNLHDVSGPDGTFKIVNIPPGEHKVRAWHERIAPLEGKIVGTVKIAAGKPAKLDVVLEMPKVK